jgi:hypothetical protein
MKILLVHTRKTDYLTEEKSFQLRQGLALLNNEHDIAKSLYSL